MKIEEGKFYLTRDGQKIGPVRVYASRDEGTFDVESGTPLGHLIWGADGRVQNVAYADFDLVAEWTLSSPVRTVTRKEIVPGTYGRVDVTGTYQGTRVTLDWTGNESIHSAPAINGLDASELRAAAEVFTQLADALEDQK